MLKKIALGLIALPTVLFLIQESFGVPLGPFSIIAEHKAIFWAAGAAVFVYSIMAYAWVLVGVTVGVFLLAKYALGMIG